MAFAPAVEALLFKRAAGFIGRNSEEGSRSTTRAHKGFTASRLYELLRPRATGLAGFSPSALRSVAERAIKSANEAERMRDNPGSVVRNRDLPERPAIDQTDLRFSYTVIVTVKEGDHVIDSWRTEVQAEQGLTADEIRADVANSIEAIRSRDYPNQATPYIVGDMHQVSIEVVGAWRLRQ